MQTDRHPGPPLPSSHAIYFLRTDRLTPAEARAWLDGAPAHLEPAELATFTRYVFDDKKLEFLLGRVVLKSTLALHGVPAPRIVAADDRSKPRLAGAGGGGGPFFNLSHSHGAIAAIVAPDREVAIDVEQVRAVSKLLSEKVLHPEERARVREPDDFYRFWTAKEAFMKLCGAGLSIPPRRLRVDLDARTVLDLETGIEQGFRSELREGYALSWMSAAPIA